MWTGIISLHFQSIIAHILDERDWVCMLQLHVKEEPALMPAMLSLAATHAPKLKQLTVSTDGESVPPLIHSISLLSSLEELELSCWDFPDVDNGLAISNLSGLRSLKVRPSRPNLCGAVIFLSLGHTNDGCPHCLAAQFLAKSTTMSRHSL